MKLMQILQVLTASKCKEASANKHETAIALFTAYTSQTRQWLQTTA
jgi:hypothetical protein